MNRAIFLDRDGVINRAILKDGKLFSPRTTDEFVFCDAVDKFVRESRKAGFLNIVFTNQPDIARGLVDFKTIEQIHDILRQKLEVDDVMLCPHDDKDNCLCRKPKSGMLIDAARKWQIDLASSFVIGDQWKDIEAGSNAGCTTILLDYPYNKNVKSDYRIKNLTSAFEIISK